MLHTILSLVTVPGHVSLVSTAITEQLCNVKNSMQIRVCMFFFFYIFGYLTLEQYSVCNSITMYEYD